MRRTNKGNLTQGPKQSVNIPDSYWNVDGTRPWSFHITAWSVTMLSSWQSCLPLTLGNGKCQECFSQGKLQTIGLDPPFLSFFLFLSSSPSFLPLFLSSSLPLSLSLQTFRLHRWWYLLNGYLEDGESTCRTGIGSVNKSSGVRIRRLELEFSHLISEPQFSHCKTGTVVIFN